MKIAQILLSAAIAFGVSFSASAADPAEKAVKARKGEMQLRSFNASPLFDMAKGKIDYDAELATTLANNLKTLMAVDMSRLWPQGSDNENPALKTRALPAIWTTYPKIAESGKAYANAVNELVAVAGDGPDALKSKIGALGKSCKGCHDDFRAEKK